MSRYLIALLLCLGYCIDLYAQDMPLSSFTYEDEPFRKVENPGKKPGPSAEKSPEPREKTQLDPVATVFSDDGGTVFSTHPDGKAIWAYVVDSEGMLNYGEPYCPLRLKQGQDSLAVYGLVIDNAERIYAATEEGIQVFDPTGRLSGVLLLPKRGIPLYMSLENNLLSIWIGDTKYAKKMKLNGV